MLQLSAQRAHARAIQPAAATAVPFVSGRLQRRSRLGDAQRARAALEPEVAAAVSQQATAFAIVLAAEAFYTRSYVPDGDKGRPEIPAVAAGAGTTLAAVALLSVGGTGPLSSIGLVVGLVSAGAMIYYNAQRFTNLQYTDADWPGPKAWPAGMGLISFFAFCAFLQSLVADVTTVAL